MEKDIFNKKILLPLVFISIVLIGMNVYLMYKFGEKYDSHSIHTEKYNKK